MMDAIPLFGNLFQFVATVPRFFLMMAMISFALISILAAGNIDSEFGNTSSGFAREIVADDVTPAPTPPIVSAELVHEDDALAALCMNVIIILCLLAAYYVKHFRYHHIPESTISLMVGVVVGGIVRLTTDNMQLWEFVSDLYLSFLLISFTANSLFSVSHFYMILVPRGFLFRLATAYYLRGWIQFESTRLF